MRGLGETFSAPGDGSLDPTELQKGLSNEFGLSISAKEAEDMVRRADSDGNGTARASVDARRCSLSLSFSGLREVPSRLALGRLFQRVFSLIAGRVGRVPGDDVGHDGAGGGAIGGR